MIELYRRRRSLRHYFGRLTKLAQLGIRPTDLVLDLGSGQDPQPRANILCDKFVADSQERACQAGVIIDRPFVVADATRTPFPNQAFDFVYCSHLLEHLDEPQRLLCELQRIGRRGYIETPSKIYEKLWGWDFHRWFVSLDGNRLVIEAKDRVIFDEDLHRWFSTQIERKPIWNVFMSRLLELELLTVLVWDGEIAYQISGEASPETALFLQAQVSREENLKDLAALAERPPGRSPQLKSLLSRWTRRHSEHRVKEVLEALECPQCRLPLRRAEKQWHCADCGMTYPIMNQVHVVLSELAQVSIDGPAVV